MEEMKNDPDKDVESKRPATPTISVVSDLLGGTSDNPILLDSTPAGVQESRHETDNNRGCSVGRAVSRVPKALHFRSPPGPRVVLVKRESGKKSEAPSSTPIVVRLGTGSTSHPDEQGNQRLTRQAQGLVSHGDNGNSSTHAIGARSRGSLVMSVLGDPVGFPRFSPFTAVASARIACEETLGNFQGGRTAPPPPPSLIPSAPALAAPAMAALAVAVPMFDGPELAVPELAVPTVTAPTVAVPAVAVTEPAVPTLAAPAMVPLRSTIFGLSSLAVTAPIPSEFAAGTPGPGVLVPAIGTPESATPSSTSSGPGSGPVPGPVRQPRRLILRVKVPPSSLARVTETTTIPTSRKRAPSNDLYTATPRRRPPPPTAGVNEPRCHPRRGSGPEPDRRHREPTTPDSEAALWDMSGDEGIPSQTQTQTQRVVRLYRRMYGSRITEGEVPECEEIPEEYEGAALVAGGSQAAEPGSPRGGLRLSPLTWGSPEPEEREAADKGEMPEDGMDIDVSSGTCVAPDPIPPYTLNTFFQTHERIRRSGIEFLNPPSNPSQNIPVGFFEWSLSQFPSHHRRGGWHPANELSPLELDTVSRDFELYEEMKGAWDDRAKLMRGLAGAEGEALELLWTAYRIRIGRLGFWEYEMSQSRRWFMERKGEMVGAGGDDVEMGGEE
ncbi:hypothetical protein B0T18DRAFT_453689 [Schizothecium vesticola]|uniref:Uncharacterized protein n=1 Tax=Schizothecium vesticola TaxID=314040 RepID=A0AA40FA53_9PEZI|nr:hypothetical protein B0T18DRAFT_453689 [Schizothecium vesticola]